MAQQIMQSVYAECMQDGCGHVCSERNATAWAHLHAKRTGHEVDLNVRFKIHCKAADVTPPKKPLKPYVGPKPSVSARILGVK